MAASVTVVLLNSFGDRVIFLPRSGKREEHRTLTLLVPSRHCEGCAESVKGVVGEVHSVRTVEVDLTRKLITVTFKGGTAVEDDIRERLIHAGHTLG